MSVFRFSGFFAAEHFPESNTCRISERWVVCWKIMLSFSSRLTACFCPSIWHILDSVLVVLSCFWNMVCFGCKISTSLIKICVCFLLHPVCKRLSHGSEVSRKRGITAQHDGFNGKCCRGWESSTESDASAVCHYVQVCAIPQTLVVHCEICLQLQNVTEHKCSCGNFSLPVLLVHHELRLSVGPMHNP